MFMPSVAVPGEGKGKGGGKDKSSQGQKRTAAPWQQQPQQSSKSARTGGKAVTCYYCHEARQVVVVCTRSVQLPLASGGAHSKRLSKEKG